MRKIFTAGILAVALFFLVSVALAGSPGLIEPKEPAKKTKEDVEKSIKLDAEVRVIVTLKETATDIKIKSLQGKVGTFKVEAKDWDKVYPKGFAATMTRKQMLALEKDPQVARVDIDQKVEIMSETAGYWSGATKARAPPPTGYNVTGDRDGLPYNYSKNDVVIAIVDTGIDPMHKDLNGTNNGGTKKVIGWYDVLYPYYSGCSAGVPCDDHGHGTHVSGIAAGEGDDNPRYKGVAPGAALVGIKVLTGGGWGYWSWVISGVNWAVANKDTYGIRIMSLSLGGWGSSDGTDPCSVALNNAVNQGIVVTVAAGNMGPQKYTINSPAAAANVITVGAMADPGYLLRGLPSAAADEVAIPKPEKKEIAPTGIRNPEDNGFYLAYWSSRGPTADNRIKPDVAAPGVMITAAEYKYPLTPTLHGGYWEMSGTSMATPLVAGVAALMLDANYTLTPTQVKTYIRNSAEQYGYGPYRAPLSPCTVSNSNIDYGCGRIRAVPAVGLAAGYQRPDQSVPKHTRISGYINDTTWIKKHPVTITTDTLPYASTLIMYDWSGYWPGIDLDLYIEDPNGNIIWPSGWPYWGWGWDRQETVVVYPDSLGTHNDTIYKWWGAGRYSLDISYK